MLRRRTTGLWLIAALVCTLLPPVLSASADEPTLAVVETDKELAPLAALLTAQLSQEGVKLVERKQLDAVLQEQALSAAGLTDRANLVKVGALVRADAFVLLSLVKPNKGNQLRVRVAETAHGVRLLDSLDAWDPQKADSTAVMLEEKLKVLVAKMELPPGQVIAVGIMDVGNNGPVDPTQQLRKRGLKAALSARLSAEPRIVVVERDDLDLLVQEKALTSGEHGGFWGSAALIDSYLKDLLSATGRTTQWELYVKDASGKERWSMKVTIPPDNAAAAQAVVEQLVPKLTGAPPAGALDSEKEAAEYYRKWSDLSMFGESQQALQMLETAHALAPQNAEYSAHLAFLTFKSKLGAGELDQADAALTELERCLNIAIEEGDSDVLTALPPLQPHGIVFLPQRRDKDVELAGRLCQLTRRLVDALKTHQDKAQVATRVGWAERDLNMMVDGFRVRFLELKHEKDRLEKAGQTADAQSVQSLMDRYLAAFEPLRTPPAHVSLQVRTLLTGKEWPLAWQWGEGAGLPYALVRCQGDRIWLLITDVRAGRSTRVLGIAGLDPQAAGPPTVWQTQLEGPSEYFSPLVGLALGEAHSYAALGFLGVVELPGTGAKGQGVLEEPRLLGQKDGLPAQRITAIAGEPERMWVAFADFRTVSGLGLYNARTGEWQTLLSSAGKGGGPLSSGERLEISAIMPARDMVLLCSQGGQYALWELDPRSGNVRSVGPSSGALLCTGTEDDIWLQDNYALLHVEPQRMTLGYAVRGPVLPLRTHPPDAWPLEDATFAPAADGSRTGPRTSGAMDMVTAAIHGDRLWCRCGRSQIAILQRGHKLEDAAKIDNDILDGGPVLQFFETPYGLLAVGQGSAGIVESEPGQ